MMDDAAFTYQHHELQILPKVYCAAFTKFVLVKINLSNETVI
jgi:hypothetical protein